MYQTLWQQLKSVLSLCSWNVRSPQYGNHIRSELNVLESTAFNMLGIYNPANVKSLSQRPPFLVIIRARWNSAMCQRCTAHSHSEAVTQDLLYVVLSCWSMYRALHCLNEPSCSVKYLRTRLEDVPGWEWTERASSGHPVSRAGWSPYRSTQSDLEDVAVTAATEHRVLAGVEGDGQDPHIEEDRQQDLPWGDFPKLEKGRERGRGLITDMHCILGDTLCDSSVGLIKRYV